MEILVAGKYFEVVHFENNNSTLFVRLKDKKGENYISCQPTAKLNDVNRILLMLDPFNPEMISEFQSSVEFCWNCFKDWGIE